MHEQRRGNGTGNSGGGGTGGGYQDTWAYTHSDTDPDAGGLYGPLLFTPAITRLH